MPPEENTMDSRDRNGLSKTDPAENAADPGMTASGGEPVSATKRKAASRKIVLLGLLGAFAMALSYIEFLLPPGLIPLPGVRLGLSNIAVILAFALISRRAGLSVLVLKLLMSLLLFGNPMSFAFSLGGSVSAYLSLLLLSLLKDKISFIGVSAVSAAAHSIGQIAVAAIFTGNAEAAAGYLPLMLLFSIPIGVITGIVMNLIAPVCEKMTEKG